MGQVEVQSPATPTPQQFRYVVRRLQGEGGLGRVYAAYDRDLNREVALKRMREDQAGHPEAVRRFLREAQVTGQLEHPNIVPVYELARGPEDDQPFYVMRLVRGPTLRDAGTAYHRRCRDGRGDSLELWRLLGAFVSVCQAIGYAHSRGVIHRDLKPDNVVLGEFGEVILLDWGLAKLLGDPDDTTRVVDSGPIDPGGTIAGERLGSPAYMAPEQAEGRTDLIDERTDVYGLGTVLFELLTGEPPHQGEDSADVYQKILAGETPRARAVMPAVPEALDAICGKAMAKERDQRYARALDLAEAVRLFLAAEPARPWQKVINDEWRRWGPYLSDRSWATVREDYSADGDAWGYLPHDLARSKAYRWGEDGIAGVCDCYQLLCFAPAFWNGKDPILKERFFGLTPAEGNHGEDVKEYYFHSDNTPTHSYMRLLYKYPQVAYPYAQLIEENRRRGRQDLEFELLDTGVFDEDRYFDIVIEYAKATPEDLCIRIEAFNRGPDAAPLHIIPHLWFRNIWDWGGEAAGEPAIRPGPRAADFVSIVADGSGLQLPAVIPEDYSLGSRTLCGPPGATLLFTDNETNRPRVYGRDLPNRRAFVKDAFHRHIVSGEDCVNPALVGTKAALHYRFPAVPAGGSVVVRLRLTDQAGPTASLAGVDEVIARRRREADDLYAGLSPPGASEDERRVRRQAYAGLLWSKQTYIFDVSTWLKGEDPAVPPPPSRAGIRNRHWQHLNTVEVMSVPDKWEYPWFSAWDLAFQCVALAGLDPDFAKDQLSSLLFDQFLHPNGQIPSYEWEFSDLNPPVHAWAVWRVYTVERASRPDGKGDRTFLEHAFNKLLINFTWWLNKVDHEGNSVLEGGFLGTDAITVIDRSARLAKNSVIRQADANAWVGLFCLNLLRIALELARENPVYEGLATKFFHHYLSLAAAMRSMGRHGYQRWDEVDGFFYDALRYPNGDSRTVRLRSVVGLMPLFAVERLDLGEVEPLKHFSSRVRWLLKNRRDLTDDVVYEAQGNGREAFVLSLVSPGQLARILRRLWDETEFRSDYGVRSLSKAHQREPFRLDGTVVGYEPAEAAAALFGGNTNWRGPIWFSTTFLLIEALRTFGGAWGKAFEVPVPGGSGQSITPAEMAREIANRLIRIFTCADSGRRPVYGGTKKFQDDPHWRDHVLFYEYFHGDNGAGLGASHFTGWTALVAALIDEWRA
jgi:serine/threonine protein kinase